MRLPDRVVVYSPCGTSLLTNAAPEHRKTIAKWANARDAKECGDDARTLQAVCERARQLAAKAAPQEIMTQSAELNGILRLYPDRLPRPQDAYILLATDTWLGEASARIVESWLRDHGARGVLCDRCKDLRTSSLEEFHLALTELVKRVEEETQRWRAAGYHVVFNLTGGFKSIQGFLQSISHVYADEAVYVFESAQELLRLPSLPVRLGLEDEVEKHLRTLARLELGLPVPREELEQLPSIFLIQVGDEYGLSPWGAVIWRKQRDALYARAIYPPPTERARFSHSFNQSVKGLTSDRVLVLNRQLEQLALFLESGANPTSLNFKRLQGPQGGSTHEFYAWSDKDARRVLCHFEPAGAEQVLVLDRLVKHL